MSQHHVGSDFHPAPAVRFRQTPAARDRGLPGESEGLSAGKVCQGRAGEPVLMTGSVCSTVNACTAVMTVC